MFIMPAHRLAGSKIQEGVFLGQLILLIKYLAIFLYNKYFMYAVMFSKMWWVYLSIFKDLGSVEFLAHRITPRVHESRRIWCEWYLCMNQIMPQKLILYIYFYLWYFFCCCNKYNLGNPFCKEKQEAEKALCSWPDLVPWRHTRLVLTSCSEVG